MVLQRYQQPGGRSLSAERIHPQKSLIADNPWLGSQENDCTMGGRSPAFFDGSALRDLNNILVCLTAS